MPLIADETRCGLGRCGHLLIGPSLGLSPDCTTLGEALGGGYCSVSGVLFDSSVFGKRPFPSTATMANDNLSSHVALATVHALMREETRVQTKATEFENAIRTALRLDGSDNHGTTTVQGRGLLLCVHFDSMQLSPLCERLKLAPCGVGLHAWPVNLVLHAYLLHKHRLRTRPSGGEPHALLIEPPMLISKESTQRVCTALRELNFLISSGNVAKIISGAFDNPTVVGVRFP